MAPAIDSVKDSAGVDIPNNGLTSDTTITLSGTANPGEELEIFNHTESRGPATADPSTGIWNKQLTNLTPADYSFTVKRRDGSGQPSAPWALRVVQALIIDTTPIQITGHNYLATGGLIDKLVRIDPPPSDTFKDWYPTSGTPPYTFTSGNDQIAVVNSAGRITGTGNGETTITVTDADNRTASVKVTISNITWLIENPITMYPTQAVQWAQSIGATPTSPQDVPYLNSIFPQQIQKTDRLHWHAGGPPPGYPLTTLMVMQKPDGWSTKETDMGAIYKIHTLVTKKTRP
ncbi:hypothetical protein EMIT0347P_160040 [Pseudomonas sp. IT-347P]